MTAPLVAPGYYVAATNLPELAAPSGHSSHVALMVGIVVAGLAALLFLGACHRREKAPSPSMTPAPLVPSRIGIRRLALCVLVVFVAACLVAGCGAGKLFEFRFRDRGDAAVVGSAGGRRSEPVGLGEDGLLQRGARKSRRRSVSRTPRVTKPTWSNHLFSCTYLYPTGSVTLSVKELVGLETTASYFNSLERQFGRAETLNDLGQGAFIAKNGDAVVRKDYKVLARRRTRNPRPPSCP